MDVPVNCYFETKEAILRMMSFFGTLVIHRLLVGGKLPF